MKNVGRKRLIEKHPSILKYIKEFINSNIDPQAEVRRRNAVEYCRGFSAKELRDYILTRFSEETSQQLLLSVSTVTRLFNPPNQSRKSAYYYKGIFDIQRCGGKFLISILLYRYLGENSLNELHDDDHYAKAQVKYLMAYLSMIDNNDTLLLSIDDKAKLKLGIPSISHHVKSRKYFVKDLGPQTSDHDFPIDNGMLLVPSGIINLPSLFKKSLRIS